MSDALKEKARRAIHEDPHIGRQRLAQQLGVTDWAARELLRELRGEPIGPRIAYFDLETTSLIADFGHILCGSILSYPSMDMVTYRLDEIERKKDWTDDKILSRMIRDKLEEHHILVGWNSKGFDVPFLNTRLVQNGYQKLKSHLHIDPMYYYRGWHGLKPRSSKLKVVAEYYNLHERKMDVDVEIWRKAGGGNKEALDVLSERCESDVRILAQIMERAFDDNLVKNIQRYA